MARTLGKARILLVDDEVEVLGLWEAVLKGKGFEVETATDGVQALERMQKAQFDILVTDLKMPRMDGMELLEHVKRDYPEVEVVMVTAHGTIATAVEAMKLGAFDYVTKPLMVDELFITLDRVLQVRGLQAQARDLRLRLERGFQLRNIIGRNRKMLEIYELIEVVSDTDSTVLIQGESGTGKELIANAIHYSSPRRDRPFIKVNCGILSEHLLESELFGHVKGAFTGAIRDRKGRFELAHTGTLFLDEIGDISPNLQLKLLRVLQEGEFERVGEARTRRVDVRIIAATNRDLEEAMKTGAFRKDLYYRLNVIAITVPPLRERLDDLPLLAQHFLKRYSRKMNKRIEGISPEALRLLENYDWPGNVRELENVVERAVVFCKGGFITERELPPSLVQGVARDKVTLESKSLREAVAQFERQLILDSLNRTNWNRSEAARRLGLHRNTLSSKIKKYGIFP